MSTPSTIPPAPRPSWPDIQTLRETVALYRLFNDAPDQEQREFLLAQMRQKRDGKRR